MLRPIIMIGCGGSGQKVVRYTRDAVERRLKEAGWKQDLPRAWQFIAVDSHGSLDDPSIPFLPQSDFVNLAGNLGDYQYLDFALQSQFGLQGARPDVFRELMGWRPNPGQVNVPIRDSAGQLRAVGRAVGLLSLQGHLYDRVRHAFDACDAAGPELVEVSRHLGVDIPQEQPVSNPIVLVVGSMAGGTGAGIMLDVVDLVRAVHVNGSFPTLIALTPDIFGSLETDAMTANSVAFMSELLNAYWDNEMPENGLIPQMVAVNTRGPHSVYVIGRRNLDGLDLSDSRNVYRAVGNVLAAVTTSVQIQQVFYNYSTVSWPIVSSTNAGGYGFADQYLPGVASSFGSATISIGRVRFRDYLQKLLLRSIVEQLANGFEVAAQITLGDNETKLLSASEKVTELARRNVETFLSDSGIVLDRIEEIFISSEVLRTQLSEVIHSINSSIPSAESHHIDMWLQIVVAQVQYNKYLIRQRESSILEEKLQTWSSEVYQSVLHSASSLSATFGIPVVISIIESARTEVLKIASEMRERAEASRQRSFQAEMSGRMQFSGTKGTLRRTSAAVQELINEISKAIVWDQTVDVQEKLAVILEAVATSLLTNIEAALQDSNVRIRALATSQDGTPSVSTGWPKNDGVVPVSFAPSPVEFFIEDYTTWPQRARELIQQSLGNPGELPIDPVEAARTLIIRGGFVDFSNRESILPLIWDRGNQAEPQWGLGQSVEIRIEDSIDGLLERIDVWLSRPATEVNRDLTEGLGAYLVPVNPITGALVADHVQRLDAFKEKLQLALRLSRPLIDIDESLNATVHPRPISSSLNIEGFPFPVGHPARQMTEEIIQQFLGTSEPIDWAFAPTECESVLVSSFLDYPVNPSVITSLTEPLAESVNRSNGDQLQFSFWKWRRAHSLQKFVPLPYELRLAAIRGFAIARVLGVMSAEERDQNVITDHGGDKQFPKWLLTATNRNNLLPVLLEAMVLSFADASTKGSSAFDAYKSLIEYGTGQGVYGKFRVGGLLRHFLETGDRDGIRIVDQARAEFVTSSNRVERAGKVIEYLQRNIERFEDLESSGPDQRSWRNAFGMVDPPDTLTHELLPDLRVAYGQVLEAVQNWLSQPAVIV
jgi:hypothetical protein